MLGSKRTAFKPTPYSYSRRKRRIPRWLVLMITGAVLGVGGLLFVQTSYGPTRLTVAQSEKLGFDLNSANSENHRLQARVAELEKEVERYETQLTSQTDRLENHDQIVQQLRSELNTFMNAVAPDPRGTSPSINAAKYSVVDGKLQQELLIMQDADKADTPFIGEIKLTVMGRYPNGKTGYVDLDPIPIKLDRYVQLIEEFDLPNGMTPRQVTVQVFEQDNPRAQANRTLNVR
ncbi:MAG TPA: hypothetical protein H9906_05725 [Candidatus Paenalcaligenes intestinipullorum]|uniref:Uncharacterized protein n=1 Tax=Candidatus Paenalcaligenes intestinipullorum TaxID=2838718 RepID=A0A9D2RGN2_9BURK|nr:hypothetical protein [Candidatus Paenalcaligenes intestinipullorum]